LNLRFKLAPKSTGCTGCALVFNFASSAATVPAYAITVIALFSAFFDTVTADSDFFPACAAATIAVYKIAVVALFNAF